MAGSGKKTRRDIRGKRDIIVTLFTGGGKHYRLPGSLHNGPLLTDKNDKTKSNKNFSLVPPTEFTLTE